MDLTIPLPAAQLLLHKSSPAMEHDFLRLEMQRVFKLRLQKRK
jgi:hypothetical protein